MPFKINIGIVGTGLIGTYIASAIKSTYVSSYIIGIDINKEHLKKNLTNKTIDKAVHIEDIESILLSDSPDFLFISIPISSTIDFIKTYRHLISELKDTVISDVASVKAPIVEVAKIYLKETKNFVSSHPMTGSEKAGPEFDLKNPFIDKPTIIINDLGSDDNIKRMEKFWTEIGSNTYTTSSKEHDKIVSIVSHIPHILAYAVITVTKKSKIPIHYGGKSFREIIRLSKSSPDLWKEIIMYNKSNISEDIDKILEVLGYIKKLLKDQKSDELLKFLLDAKETTDSLYQKKTAKKN